MGTIRCGRFSSVIREINAKKASAGGQVCEVIKNKALWYFFLTRLNLHGTMAQLSLYLEPTLEYPADYPGIKSIHMAM